ncbi:MAG: pilus assembly protein PilP [Deltaproteobacteria bacterium]|nr:pilus assembly protein PilP [Deltaproteobacteria bacterium]
MAKSKKATAFQRIVIIGSFLIVVQLVIYFLFNRDKPNSVRDAINRQIEQMPGTPREKDMKRILAAVHDYRQKTLKFPQHLVELIPDYFDSIPLDPDTGAPFKYTLVNNSPQIGDNEDKKKGPETDDEAMLAALTAQAEATPFVYDPTGKRDPFRPFSLAPQPGDLSNKTPLEKYGIGQLKLTAVLGAGDEGSAMVENSLGKGFTVKKGTKIGVNGGEVIEILADRILILETSTDFTGETKTKTIEMRLRTKDQE